MKRWYKYPGTLMVFIGLWYVCSAGQIKESRPTPSVPVILNDTTYNNLPKGNNSMSFLAIYHTIIEKNCALSSCHDGNFEPNFTSPQAAYYTTVMHEIFKNSTDYRFLFRVVPFDTANSMLYERLTNCCLNNDQDRMPLLLGSLSRGQIDSIGMWIMNGAPDAFGEFPYLDK